VSMKSRRRDLRRPGPLEPRSFTSPSAAAVTALLAYALFALFVAWWEVRHPAISRRAM
jgi:hypothetical protein